MKIKVGFVGDGDGETVKSTVDYVLEVDPSGNYFDIVEIESVEKANNMLEADEISGYFYMPTDFLKSAFNGNNIPGKFVLKKSGDNLVPLVVNDVLLTVSNFVVESQAGVFAMLEYYDINDLDSKNNNMEMSFNYLGYVLSRDKFTNIISLNSYGLSSFKCYYLGSILVILILVIGIFMAGFAVKNNLSLNCILYSRGCSSGVQTIGEYVSFLSVPLLAVALVLGALSLFGSTLTSMIPELYGFGTLDFMVLFIKFIPAILLLTSMQFFIYELCNNLISATLLQFVVSIVLSYTSGCFYPKSFFPETMRNISSFMPVDISFSYIRNVLTSSDKVLGGAVICVVLSIAFLLASVLVRRTKIRSCM